MKYRVEIGEREIVIEVIEREDRKMKVNWGNGVANVEWALCEQFPMISVIIDGKPHCFFIIKRNGERYIVGEGRPLRVSVVRGVEKTLKGSKKTQVGMVKVTSPLSGLVTTVLVELGERVRKGQPLVVLEAMKMRNEIKAQVDGRVVEINAEPGISVELGQVLLSINTGE